MKVVKIGGKQVRKIKIKAREIDAAGCRENDGSPF